MRLHDRERLIRTRAPIVALSGEAAADPVLRDVAVLAAGFETLSDKASAPAPAPPAAAPPAAIAAAVTAAAPAPPRIYDAAYPGLVVPGVSPSVKETAVASDPWASPNRDAVLAIVIDEKGPVESARMTRVVHRTNDELLLSAVSNWAYVPAQLAGEPVKFSKVMKLQLSSDEVDHFGQRSANWRVKFTETQSGVDANRRGDPHFLARGVRSSCKSGGRCHLQRREQGLSGRDARRLGMDLGSEDGEFIVLVGPSGCGKTTALRMVAGLEDITEGEIRIGERVVNHVPAARPRHRDGLPELRALPAPLRPGEHGLRAEAPEARQAGGRTGGSRTRPGSSASTSCSTRSRARSPAGSASGSRWAARSSASRRPS